MFNADEPFWMSPGDILYKHIVLYDYFLKLYFFSIWPILCSLSLFPIFFSRLNQQKYLETVWCAAFCSIWRSQNLGRKLGVWSPNKTLLCCTCTVLPRYRLHPSEGTEVTGGRGGRVDTNSKFSHRSSIEQECSDNFTVLLQLKNKSLKFKFI